MTLVLLLGVLIGAIMGLTGAGGGILAVPVLVAGMHWTMQQAAPVALIAVAAGAAVGAIDGFKRGLVRYKAATLMAICGIPVTRMGQHWAHDLPQHLLMSGFALLMLWVAWRFYQQSKLMQSSAEGGPMPLAFIHHQSGKFIWKPLSATVLACVGALTGLMTGLLGVGGGFLIVPLMRRFTNLAIEGIVATSLMVITLVGSGGVVNALWAGAELPAAETASFVSAMVVGMLIGRRVSHRLKAWHIQRGFAMLLLAVALQMLIKVCLNPI